MDKYPKTFALMVIAVTVGFTACMSLAIIANSAVHGARWAIDFANSNPVLFAHLGAMFASVVTQLFGAAYMVNAERRERVWVRRV